MSTTKYVTGTANGIMTLVARAVDPNGNIIANNISIEVGPPRETVVLRCYTNTIAVSVVQNNLESACAQFGSSATYYIGTQNKLYVTPDCSTIAQDGYYKLDDGSWILVNAGGITNRGSCAVVGQTVVDSGQPTNRLPQLTTPQDFVPFVTPTAQPIIPTAFTPIQVYVPEITFTPFAPTIAPPPVVLEPTPVVVGAPEPTSLPVTPAPVIVPSSTTTTTFIPEIVVTTTPSVFTPATTGAPQTTLGCTDPMAINYNPNATGDDGSCQYAGQFDNQVSFGPDNGFEVF